MKNNEKKTNEDKKTSITVSERVLNASFAILALILIAVTEVVLTLWTGNGSNVFAGIVKIVIYASSIAGIFWNYFRYRKLSVEFWMSVATFVLTIRFI